MKPEKQIQLEKEIADLKLANKKGLNKIKLKYNKQLELLKRDANILKKYDLAVIGAMYYAMAHKIWTDNACKADYCNKDILSIEYLMNVENLINLVESPNLNLHPTNTEHIKPNLMTIKPQQIKDLHNKVMAWWDKEAKKNKFKNI